MMYRSMLAAACLLATGSQAYAPIQMVSGRGKGLVVLPQGFPGNFRGALTAQRLSVRSPASNDSPRSIPYFTARLDQTITWDDVDWCLEATGNKNGDAVRVNGCSGARAQKWNWIPDGRGHSMIQLSDTELCLHAINKKVAPSGAPIELQECGNEVARWQFEELLPLPRTSQGADVPYDARHVMIALLTLAGLGAVSLGARIWQVSATGNRNQESVCAVMALAGAQAHASRTSNISMAEHKAVAPPAKRIRPGNVEDVIDVLLNPKERVHFQEAGEHGASLKAGRDMWIVGTNEELQQAAKCIADTLNLPVLTAAAAAATKKIGDNGSTKVASFLIGEEFRMVTLLAVPKAESYVVCPARPDVIAKHMHGKIRGKDVVIAVADDCQLATGLAVARCLPPYSSKVDVASPADATIRFHGATPEPLLEKLNHMATSLRIAQGLVDMPPNVIEPVTFKEFTLAAAKGLNNVTTQVIEGTDLRDQGYGGIWNVGKSADGRPPCLIVLTHDLGGTKSDMGGVALVGKGITYDTGGAALKAREGMCGMKRDMAGAAGVFGAWLAAVKCGGLPSGAPLHCVLCIAENGIGPGMFLHDDIITHYSGLTSEINNTDAEGRLVLADGVAHAAKNLGAELVVDMATLTGAQGVSTGQHFSSFLATDEQLERDVVVAGRKCGECAHPGIFAPELLLPEFDSEFADMKNSVKNRSNAQSSCAGLFIYKHLKHAGHQGRWLHVDMAYPSFQGEYATGYGVGLLCAQLGVI